MNTIITARDVVKTYGAGDERRNVLDGVSVQIHEGEFVSVMGPSGSGKSTLMYTLSGMDSIDAGEIVFDGRDLTTLNDNELADLRRTTMGFVFQQPTLLSTLNILDNVILTSVRGRRRDVASITQRAQSLMDRAGIGDLAGRQVTQASGGQLQRVGVCRALMNDPKVIFGDEPTGALNSAAAEEIMALFSEIHRTGTTIVLVTHDIRVAARTERVLFLLDGTIRGEFEAGTYDGTPEALRHREERLTAWLTQMGF